MREHHKRWLMSKLRSSGSRRPYPLGGDYATERHATANIDFDDLPRREGFKRGSKLYNGKINFGPLVRFLRGQAGRNWDDVYSEILERIPTDLLDYWFAIFWFVADKVDIVDGAVWNRKSHKFIWTQGEKTHKLEYFEFYVDPVTRILIRVPDAPSRRISKTLNGVELKNFRDSEIKRQRARRGFKRTRRIENSKAAGEILKEDNRNRGRK